MKIAEAFNKAVSSGELSAPVILGRDHHDVSGTDSPYRETSNIYDGSRFTSDMAVQNFVGDSFRGATWISLHNGGGVGWGEVINGGFGMTIDGSKSSEEKIKSLINKVNNPEPEPKKETSAKQMVALPDGTSADIMDTSHWNIGAFQLHYEEGEEDAQFMKAGGQRSRCERQARRSMSLHGTRIRCVRAPVHSVNLAWPSRVSD